MTNRIILTTFPWQKNKFHFCSIEIFFPPVFPPVLKILIIDIILLKNLIAHNDAWLVINCSFYHISTIKN